MSSNVPLFSIFSKYPNLVHGLSTKEDKQMKVRYELGNDSSTLDNRKKFLQKFYISDQELVSAKLAQKDIVAMVGKKDRRKFIENTDGLVTNVKGIFLSITVADCLPIFMYDPKKQIIGIVHAGWKGLNMHIAKNAIEKTKTEYNSDPSELLVGIGPSIGFCHFAVKEDVQNKFLDYQDVTRYKDNQCFLDLKNIAKQQLMQSGVKEHNIEINPLCTFCESYRYYSYRRDNSSPIEAMMAIIGMRD